MSPTNAMEHHPPFSVDDLQVPADPMSTLQQPPTLQLQAQVLDDGDFGGGVATSEDAAAVCDATDLQQSPSEWSFERLLEEELMMTSNTPPRVDSSGSPVLHVEEPVPEDAVEAVEPAATVARGGTADPVEYNAMLKRKLEEDLAAVAMWRASSTVHPEGSQGWHVYNGESDNLAQNKFRDGTGHYAQNAGICSKFPARSSSMEASPSEDDDMDGEVEVLRSRKPDAEKVKKRKESNRESARRSRSRKAAHVKDLEDQVTHLKVENSLLLRRLDAINQKYTASAIDNRILRADMETLRVKIKMAEDTVNRLTRTGTPPFVSSMPFVVGSPSSHAAHPDPSAPIIIQDSNIATSYVPRASGASRANNGYLPSRAAAPSPLQAEGVVNGSSTSNSSARKMNRIAASHCATTAMEGLLHERVGLMAPRASAGAGAALWGPAAPSGLEYEISDADMEGH